MTAGVKFTGDWVLARKLLRAGPAAVEKAMVEALHGEALHFEKAIKKTIQGGLGPPLKRGGGGRNASGQFVKSGRAGGSKPLIATGDLLGSITVVTAQGGRAAFIGIPRSATAHGGRVVRLAEIHEFGRTIVIRLTEKMRRFLFAVLFKDSPRGGSGSGAVKRGFIIVHIPARPFIRPTFAREAPGAQERFVKRVARALGKDYGTA